MKLTLKIRPSSAPEIETFKKSVAALLLRSDLTPEARADAAFQAFAQGPRQIVSDANLLIDILASMRKEGGESWPDQMLRISISQKALPFFDTKEEATIDLSGPEVKYLKARLGDGTLKLPNIPVLVGIFLLELMTNLGMSLEALFDTKEQ